MNSFLSKIIIDDNGCWNWTAFRDKDGYAKIKINNKSLMAHRFIFEYFNGEICPDLTIDHLCRNRSCVNPIHLEQVTMRENNLRGTSPTSANAKKTHCHIGHELTGCNLYVSSDGHRHCDACRKDRYQKNKEFFKIKNTNYWKNNKHRLNSERRMVGRLV